MPKFSKLLVPPFRTLSAQFYKPLIAIGPGSVAKFIEDQFEYTPARTVSISDKMFDYLDGDRNKIAKMSPREITSFAQIIADDIKADGYIFPGSVNTIPLIFRDINADIPKELDTWTARGFFKMALTEKALLEGKPSIYSCDSFHYPTTILGGKISESPSYEMINHNGYSHAIIIKKGSWLEQRIRNEGILKEDFHDDIIIRNVSSTHPLLMTELPKGAKVLATAPDNSASIVLFNQNAMGILDHIETGISRFPYSSYESNKLELELLAGKEHNLTTEDLWEIIQKEFLDQTIISREKPSTTVSPKFNARILEIINTKNLAELDGAKVFTSGLPTYNKGR